MIDIALQMYTTAPTRLGLNCIQQQAILAALKFPLLFAHAVLPPDGDVRECFPRLMNQGCGLLFGFMFTYNGEYWGHGTVAESYSDDGVIALCSGNPAGDGAMVRWHTEGPDDEPEDIRPHGRKIIVPWLTQEYDKWVYLDDRSKPVGITRDFIVVWPAQQ